MPAWLQQILVAVGGFIGGRMISTVGDRMEESRELRRSVDRLALAVEQVPLQISGLRGEIHEVGARNEKQLEALRAELHDHKMEQERRFGSIEMRLDNIAIPPQPPPAPTRAQFMASRPQAAAERPGLDEAGKMTMTGPEWNDHV